MLDGQGGDELLLGYERYYSAILRDCNSTRFFKEIWQQSKNSRLNIFQILQYYVYFSNYNIRIQYLKSRNRHILPSILNAHCFDNIKKSTISYKNVKNLQICEIGTLQLTHLLRYEDRCSMRHSIETRLPFLDYRLVEMAVSLSLNHKIRDGWTKYILREAVADVLPKEIVWRKNKIGFEAPAHTWISEHNKYMKEEIRKSNMLRSITNIDKILKDFSFLPIKNQWKYFNISIWEKLYNIC